MLLHLLAFNLVHIAGNTIVFFYSKISVKLLRNAKQCDTLIELYASICLFKLN